MEKKSQVQIRSIEKKDLKTVLEMNNSAVPAVNELNAEDLEWYTEVAKAFFVAELEELPNLKKQTMLHIQT